ncbi:diguanylate cyclase [Vibrio sp. MACH09]|uniref:sensor domain-containing diguanylate cyclase n=1 Tax=Vibrio sp. MACH09 TaxID=3025122 RepID=UPI0027936B90|nr:diguanylate cyclase [Vibrio sp. MACH09]GLO60383.1 diguanylate cyclase [Vibrio sp. MACH09]
MTIQTGSFDNLDHAQANNLENELLAAIARSAEDLTTGRGWPEGVNALLQDLGKITKVSRVWIFQTLELQAQFVLQDYVFEWASDEKYVQIGLPSFNRFKSNRNEPEYQSLIESRMRGEYQDVTTSLLPDTWLKTYLEGQRILSMLTIPIFVENKWWGTLGFDDCERDYQWSASEIALLRTASFLISGAVLRDSLSAKTRQLEVLKKITAFSAWELDIRRGHLWCTSELLSRTPEKHHNLQFSFRQWLRLIHPDYRCVFFDAIRQFIRSGSDSFQCDLKIATESRDERWVEVSATVDKNPQKKGDFIAGILLDITQRKEEEERLRYEASTDPLTGVLNRRKIDSLIYQHILEYRKNKHSFSLIFMDLDYFKRINDNYGHHVGDKVLCHFTQLCQQVLRSVDYLARIGGEEFAILLPNTNEADAFAIGDRIRSNLQRRPYLSDNEEIPYSVSVGCFTVRDERLDQQEIFKRADEALYLAKQSGRNQVKVS